MFELKDTTKKFLELNNFKDLTSVQKVTLDNFNSKKDIFIVSKTGTGKTHAYLIPICESINTVSNKTQVLISSPTRELAYQIYQQACVLKEVYPDIRISLISSRDNKTVSNTNIPHIVIGTPGRLKTSFEQSLIRVDTIQLLVIDEADMTLEYGFLQDLDYIFSRLIRHSKVMCFSATLKNDSKHFILKYLYNPVILTVSDKRKDPSISHYLINTKHRTYNETLLKILPTINPFVCMIFANSKEECEDTYDYLTNHGYKAMLLHGGLEVRDRKRAIKDLQSNKYTYVVCSDVASRGIDIDACSHVISLGLPKKTEFYIHRSGRTGRNGRKGEAFVIYDDKDINAINILKKEGIDFIQKDIKGNKLSNVRIRKHRLPNTPEMEKEINKIVSKKDKKVKPNYKKKKKQAIEKIKKKARREYIKGKIKEQRKERYRQAARNKS